MVEVDVSAAVEEVEVEVMEAVDVVIVATDVDSLLPPVVPTLPQDTSVQAITNIIVQKIFFIIILSFFIFYQPVYHYLPAFIFQTVIKLFQLNLLV